MDQCSLDQELEEPGSCDLHSQIASVVGPAAEKRLRRSARLPPIGARIEDQLHVALTMVEASGREVVARLSRQDQGAAFGGGSGNRANKCERRGEERESS